MNTPIKIEFAPGCFDQFTGNQEELDAVIAEIKKLAETGELLEKSNFINLDELGDNEEEEIKEALLQNTTRLLH